jgi:N,N'-diacetyllegionaminate synthase
MTKIKTNFSTIGDENPCYIIAEIGSNHNGNFDIATELIEKAAEAGVNAVKFQTFKAKHHYSKNTKKISLYKEDIYNLIEKLEIDRSWHLKLADLCRKKNIDFLDSPCDFEAIELAIEVGMPLMKVASFDMIDDRLIEKISKSGRGLIFSTGMAKMSEIENAVNIARKNNNDQIAILQCTSLYPAPCSITNLKAMNTMKLAFNAIVGYSDHTLGDHISCSAVAMGAKIIEKHYTLDRTMSGPDHIFAIEPTELKIMVNKIRDIESAFGDGIKNGPRKEEMEFYENARRSIFSNRDIKKGEIIKDEDLVIKRPNYGIHPSNLNIIVGRIAQEDIKIDQPITWDLI